VKGAQEDAGADGWTCILAKEKAMRAVVIVTKVSS
jgi:hypothetical protein